MLKRLQTSAANGVNEQVSLEGYDEDRVGDLLRSLFGSVLTVPAGVPMVRFTFVVGGGKGCRRKFDADLQKFVVAALRDVEFVEDKSASCGPASAGCYKTQHDTAANLKYVHVFPRVKEAPQNQEDAAEEVTDAPRSKMQICVESELATFKKVVERKLQSWSQKKRVLDAFKREIAALEECDELLIKGDSLSPSQQQLYESDVDIDILRSKCKFLQACMQTHVNEHTLTPAEVQQLRSMIDEKLAVLDDDATAPKDLKLRRYLDEQRKLLDKCSPTFVSTVGFKNESLLLGVYDELRPLAAAASGGKLLSLKQLTQRSRLEEKLEKLLDLAREEAWFEEEAEFEQRISALRRRSKGASKPKPSSVQKQSKRDDEAADGGWQTSKGNRGKSKPSKSSASVSNPFDVLNS